MLAPVRPEPGSVSTTLSVSAPANLPSAAHGTGVAAVVAQARAAHPSPTPLKLHGNHPMGVPEGVTSKEVTLVEAQVLGQAMGASSGNLTTLKLNQPTSVLQASEQGSGSMPAGTTGPVQAAPSDCGSFVPKRLRRASMVMIKTVGSDMTKQYSTELTASHDLERLTRDKLNRLFAEEEKKLEEDLLNERDAFAIVSARLQKRTAHRLHLS